MVKATIDYSSWGGLKRRVEQESRHKLRNNSSGMVRVHLELYVDAEGNLVGWEEPDCLRLEPSRINWCEALQSG